MPKTLSNHLGVVALGASLLAGCAVVPPPNEQLTISRAASEAAELSGAAELAPTELATAKTKLERALVALAANRNLDARRLADEAAVDAELAQARAATNRARAAATQVDQSIRALRDEIDRANTPPPGTGVLGYPPSPAAR